MLEVLFFWDCGAFCNVSLCSDEDVSGLLDQYGPPDRVEVR